MAILSRTQVSAYAQQAGFSGQALNVAVAIAQAESGFNQQATNKDSNGTTDYGLWQINSAHGYDSAKLLSSALYNAQAAYAISSQGKDFSPWTTYQSGAYKQYMPASNNSSVATQVKSASSNVYPKGQCTWWANERYHALTGYYVPWVSNAKDWATDAQDAGWQVSSKPSTIPAIIVLQPGVQGADSQFGHVAIAESVNADGSVHCSTQNWNNVTYPNVTYVDFKTGNGVQFVSAGAGTTAPHQTDSGNSGSSSGFTPFLQQIHNTLINTPGFYGMALAIDESEQFSGWVDLTDHSGSSGGFLGWLNPSSGFDIVGFTRSLGATISDNVVPFAIRSSLVMLGSLLILFLLLKVAFGIAENGLAVVKEVAPLAAAVA